MDTHEYMGFVTNPPAAGGSTVYGTAAPTSSSWPTCSPWATAATAAPTVAQQPFASPQPSPYIGAESYYGVDPQQYDGASSTVSSVAAMSPGCEYADAMSPAMTAESTRKKRSRRRSSAVGGPKPAITVDGGTHPHRTTQLRTAQRSSKYSNSSHRPAETVEERKARAMHNQVEQQYRKRLNAQFERLLAVLPPEDSTSERRGIRGGCGGSQVAIDGDDRRVSKAEVLDMARQRIKELEKERANLERQKRELVGNAGRLRDEWAMRIGSTGIQGG